MTETKRPPLRSVDAGDPVAAEPSPVWFVARGRTVLGPDGRYHGPGSPLALAPGERDHMIKTGFLVREPPILEPTALEAAAANPTNIGLQTQHQKFQGPV